MKFSVGVLIAIVLQVSAFVWWTAQQAQTISQLNEESALTSRMAVEDNVNLKRDIADIKQKLSKQDDWIEQNYNSIEDLIDFATFTENRWADAYALDPSYERKFGTKAPVK
jgi:Tfp pilus assembly protein PilN